MYFFVENSETLPATFFTSDLHRYAGPFKKINLKPTTYSIIYVQIWHPSSIFKKTGVLLHTAIYHLWYEERAQIVVGIRESLETTREGLKIEIYGKLSPFTRSITMVKKFLWHSIKDLYIRHVIKCLPRTRRKYRNRAHSHEKTTEKMGFRVTALVDLCVAVARANYDRPMRVKRSWKTLPDP